MQQKSSRNMICRSKTAAVVTAKNAEIQQKINTAAKGKAADYYLTGGF